MINSFPFRTVDPEALSGFSRVYVLWNETECSTKRYLASGISAENRVWWKKWTF